MPQRELVGTRIRERRQDRGLRQSDLARTAGISPSYLNLIEHNRRRIAGRLLHRIADILEVDPAVLARGAEGALVDALRTAAARAPRLPEAPAPEIDRLEDFAGRFPGWAALAAAQDRQIGALEARVRALGDRVAHDPQLAQSLHEVISAVTSIRSTSAILADDEGLDADWRRRFHANIYEDARRLADHSRAVVDFLEAPQEDRIAPLSPLEEADALLADGTVLARLEHEGTGAAAALLEDAEASLAGREVAAARLMRHAADAAAMPLDAVRAHLAAAGPDPAALAVAFGVPLDRALRRLGRLPGEGAPAAGLYIADGAGAIVEARELPGVEIPRTGGGCPLWPLFDALGQPGRPLRAEVRLPGTAAQPLMAYAVARPSAPPGFGGPLLPEATMLLVPAAAAGGGAGPRVEAGPGCRVCPRGACPARREPSILAALS